jgi:hypothetical protein
MASHEEITVYVYGGFEEPVAIVACCNASANEKFKLSFIGKFKKTHALKNVAEAVVFEVNFLLHSSL